MCGFWLIDSPPYRALEFIPGDYVSKDPFCQELLEGEKPAIGELLPESALTEVRRILDTLLDSVRDRVVGDALGQGRPVEEPGGAR